ncbi:MAG TPA: hypothetical protein VK604_24775 [Bryobacteraceae bacterium]|nr:hypothetical protein [Bryobacteraceae bacterium]
MNSLRIPLAILSIFLLCSWGSRGHMAANKAAIDAMPADGPSFLANYREWIAATGPLPDSWRYPSEPYSKIFEDPNHGWFREQFAFMATIPRSRYEFVLRLYDEYLAIKDKDAARAKLTNVRWTGTLPYAAMENFDRMKSAMRLYRQSLKDTSDAGKAQSENLRRDIAFYVGWLGHYTADGAQPLHDTIHHDGWQGPNPHGYTTDHAVHGRFESKFVDSIGLTESDLQPLVSSKPARVLNDPFAAMIHHLNDASTHVEQIYCLDQAGALNDPHNKEAAALVKSQLSNAALLLRDLTYTAWIQSGEPQSRGTGPNPIDPSNPTYNPATGSAPPEGPAIPNTVRF